MPVGARYLTVLGEFKPFGLIAEAVDGKSADIVSEKYDYFLFDSKVVRQREEDEFDALDNALSDHSDHELFIRGNRITWSAGSRVFKRFTLSSTVIMACWCRLNEKSEALLCVLQVGSLTVYHISGEIVSTPLPRTITSIWPLPFGLLLQQTTEGRTTPGIPSSSSHPLLGSKDIPHMKREYGQSPDHHFATLNTSNIREDAASVSSHLILRGPPEEPQPLLIEERGKLNLMKEFDEKTIWTSDCIPFMASYHEGKMQHSLWVAEVVNPDLEVENVPGIAPVVVLPKNFSFRRIWQGKGAQRAASEVFLATDDDTAPLICFLLREQKKLLTVGLQSLEINNEVIFDIKPDMSWSVPAIEAVPVIVTRPRAKSGLLPFTDIIVLDTDNSLLLYSGKQCLCRYLFPASLGKDHFSCSFRSSEIDPSTSSDLKIVKLLDAVEGRVNIVSKNGQIFRCALRRSPSSSLANDCIIAMSEGLRTNFYNSFLALVWGDGDSAEFCKADLGVDSEWESFSRVMLLLCKKSKPPKVSRSASNLAWDFLTESEFHKNYTTFNHFSRARSSMNLLDSDSRDSVNTSGCPQEAFHFDLLRESLESLHAVYESLKLDNLRKRDLRLLVLLLCEIANVLGEEGYLDHYIRDFPGLSKRFGVVRRPNSCAAPPSLFRWLETCLQYGCDSANSSDLPPLICEFGSSVVNWARKIVVFYSLFSGAKQIGKRLSCGVFCDVAGGFYSNNQEQMVLAMVGERFGLQQLDVLPAGVSLPLRHALDKCRESPPMGWPSAAYVLLGREELASSHMASSSKYKGIRTQTNLNLISISTPYMLHLHPVSVPSTTSDSIGLENTKFDDTDSVDGTMVDGMEHIFSSTTQLRYGRDLRLNEVRRLLCSARPVAIQTSVNPSALDQDLQQTQLWQLAQRTTTLPMGRGAFTLATMHTLLTEALTVPKLVLAGRLPTQQNATVNLDPNIRNIRELRSWPEFHNAVAAGLRLAPVQGKMSRTWIIYNRPEEPNGVHAGLLLALGLHGHLRVLKMIDIYQYLSQEHESTTVGVMLGLGASYRGTMEQAISKSLYVHVPSRYTSFPELEVPTILQSAALMSIGMLFEGSAHPPTMQTLLAELGRRSGGDNVLEREGHAVSAGFSLGLVGLGRGSDALGVMDTLVSRLFQYIGGKELPNERSLLLTLPMEDQNRGAGQMMDGTSINVDVTAPGAIMALSLIFLKAESEEIVSSLSIPNTHFELQYVRPDFIMLRVIARNLIMWSRIQPSMDWIRAQIPEVVKNGVEALNEELDDIGDMDAKAFVQAYVNIVTGACISLEIVLPSTAPLSDLMRMTTPHIVTVGSFRVTAIFFLGLRYAGTRDENAQELLYQCAVYFLNEIKPVTGTCEINFPKGLLQHVDRGTLEICLYPIVLSLSVVMAGSGHLRTLRLLRFLRARNSADGHANFGYQMAVSLATGFLFLGEGMRTFSTSNSSVATLLISLYPRLPTGPNDNRCHLQAFRHLYVLATESRCIQTLDVDTGLPVYAPLEITIRKTEHYAETSFSEVTPCILPERSVLKRVTVCGPRYWPQVIELIPEERPWWFLGDKNDPFNSGVLYIKRKVGACSYVDDPVGCQSLLSRAMHKVGKFGSLHSDSTGNQGRGVHNPIAVDQLISTFSSDPSLITFSQLCCDPSWNTRSDVDFQEFCLQILFECVSKDRPALLQVYLSLYTRIGSMADEIAFGTITSTDSLDIFSIKIAIAYNEALLSGRLSDSRGGIIKSDFIGSIRKRVEDLLNQSHGLRADLANYLNLGRWPSEDPSRDDISSMILSWYLQWFSVPPASVVKNVAEKIRLRPSKSSSIPFLRLLLPRTHSHAINEIDKLLVSS